MYTSEDLDLYVTRLDGFSDWPQTRQIDFLAYFLSNQLGMIGFTAKDIEGCFTSLALRPYQRLAVYLSENVGKKDGRYIKSTSGYRLERGTFDEIRMTVDSEPRRTHVSQQLERLVAKVKNSQQREFLQEALNCYRVHAFRATILMVWMLAIDHLQRYVFGGHLADFNTAIASHSDKKMLQVMNYDDFSNIKESRFIEILRNANIITNDVRKILDEKLGIRNSAGHPSGIVFNGHKTTEFAYDLIENILLKYS